MCGARRICALVHCKLKRKLHWYITNAAYVRRTPHVCSASFEICNYKLYVCGIRTAYVRRTMHICSGDLRAKTKAALVQHKCSACAAYVRRMFHIHAMDVLRAHHGCALRMPFGAMGMNWACQQHVCHGRCAMDALRLRYGNATSTTYLLCMYAFRAMYVRRPCHACAGSAAGRPWVCRGSAVAPP